MSIIKMTKFEKMAKNVYESENEIDIIEIPSVKHV